MKIIDIRNKTPRSNGTRKLSVITKIARHHSATTDGNWDAFWRHWNGVKGWGTGGYHEIILRNGDVQLCYDPHEITNGVKGHNTNTYHICVVGNGSFTEAQEKAFDERARLAMQRLNLKPSDVLGHNEFSGQKTSCPGINMTMVRNRLSKKEEVKVANDKGKATLNLPQWQKEETAKIYKLARDKGVFSSSEHEKNVKNGEMSIDQAIFLMTAIAGAALNGGKRVQ